MNKNSFKHKLTIGWREWLALPELGVPAIKAKVDTGARTSALHTFQIEAFEAQGKLRVRFGIHPLQRRTDIELFCVSDVVDERMVTDSGGHRELRYVIQTPVRIGTMQWPIEVSLTDRDTMLFRILLGRSAIKRRFLVDSARSYQTGRSLAHSYS
ncbi:MAG: RimK/LysX family protein [Pseudomonadota bacterium]